MPKRVAPINPSNHFLVGRTAPPFFQKVGPRVCAEEMSAMLHLSLFATRCQMSVKLLGQVMTDCVWRTGVITKSIRLHAGYNYPALSPSRHTEK